MSPTQSDAQINRALAQRERRQIGATPGCSEAGERRAHALHVLMKPWSSRSAVRVAYGLREMRGFLERAGHVVDAGQVVEADRAEDRGRAPDCPPARGDDRIPGLMDALLRDEAGNVVETFPELTAGQVKHIAAVRGAEIVPLDADGRPIHG